MPEVDLVINYEIQQKNADKWNGVLGFNWDFDKRWSWAAEYNGFVGSREAFISSVTWRL